MNNIKNLTSLFLSQSYMDAWEDYKRALTRPGFACWDYVILTASNEQQAMGFRAQLKERENAGFLPPKTHFAVIPDPHGKRVGSGGATLGVIRYIAKQTGNHDFKGLRILVIHSGGDSKRVPQYSALGKLFSPVPHELPNGRSSTLFDEFMIVMASVAGRIREGMLLLSGDVLLLFNPLLVDYSGNGATAISFKESVETGKNHGVFLRGDDGNVKRFLHKQSVDNLRKQGAVNEQNCVDIDTGSVIFSPQMLSGLYSLISENGVVTDASFERYVNEKVRLSLYGDFLYPLSTDATLEDFYKENPEGEMCEELLDARKAVWEVLHSFRLKLLRLAPAKFIHFGTSREILQLMSSGVEEYEGLGWSRHVNSSFSGNTAGYNSVLSLRAKCGENCYFENSYVHHGSVIGDNVILSYVDVNGKLIPDNVVLHGLKQKDGRFVARIYGIMDNPKGDVKGDFLGSSLNAFMEKYSLSAETLWEGDVDHTIWNANLYPSCSNIDEAVDAALNLYDLLNGRGNLEAWMNVDRKSLCSGFNEADAQAIIDWDTRMGDLVRMDRIAKLIENGEPAEKAIPILNSTKLTSIQEQWMERNLRNANFMKRIRLYFYIGTALGGTKGEEYLSKSFECIGEGILKATVQDIVTQENCHIVKEWHKVSLPLRVNWGGGWSDTPPYCNEMGGTVLNAAILLNNECPVEVTLVRIEDRKIVFDSRDMDVHGEFSEIGELQRTGDPYDSFALQKAALVACGIIPQSGGNLTKILDRIGGGFEMHSEVTGVPKGSGLGTSSILAAACVKALLEFMGIAYSEDTLYGTVLRMEQIMSTGGGWQDQVGGLSAGIKMITSKPGIRQDIKVEHLHLQPETMKELQERFVLIYTGQRRLARNLLRDVVGRFIGANPDAVYALSEIQVVAGKMQVALENGDIDGFAALLNEHWKLSKTLDAGSSNILIEQIFESIEDLIDGRMICGAGGGGFLQCIMKKDCTVEQIHSRLKAIFQDSDIDVWDCRLT
ncbi:MAG: L-fucokinase [Lachnospiraceae bacterium]